MAGVYVHIPFCASKCAYCDFYSVPSRQSMTRVVTAIGEEWTMRASELTEPPSTLYIGGGTPSLLPDDEFARLASMLPAGDVREFTIEANPDDVTAEKVKTWREAGAARVSMGVQSLVDTELREVGRRHTAAQAVEAVRLLREGGVSNISLDLIYGLPGQTLDTWRQSLDRIIALHPEHVSAYLLSVEPGTRLYARRLAGRFTPADEDTVVAMYSYLCRAMHEAGYEHYEISNFALPGRRSRHNSAYWDFAPYVGLGPAAHGCGSDGLRRVNPADIRQYLARIEARTPAYTVEEETETDRLNDRILASLRRAEGLSLSTLPAWARTDLLRAARSIPASRLRICGDTLSIPEEAFLVSDAVIRQLLLS